MFEQFPYTNFHDLNLDWIIKIAKDFLDQYTHIQDTITNGLDSLDSKAQKLEALLQAWYDTHSDDIADQLADALNDMAAALQTNIESFNLQADTKAASAIASIPSDYTALSNQVLELEKYNSFNIQPRLNGTSGTNHSITYTKNDDSTWTLNGTADAISARNIAYYQNGFPSDIEPGRKYFLKSSHNVPYQIYYYNGTETLYIDDMLGSGEFRVPANANGMLLRFRIPAGATFNNTRIRVEIVSASEYTDPSTLNPTNDTTDRTQEILEILRNFKVCHLAPGNYYVSNLVMPDNTALIGSGADVTNLYRIEDSSHLFGIKICKGNTVANLSLWGSETDIDVDPLGANTGILFEANYGAETDAYESTQCFIENVRIYNFSDSGIKCNKTSINYAKGLYAVNVYIQRCHVGIHIPQHSEFNKFTNICTAWCWYGCINNSGNNVFTACTFHATNTGFYVNGDNPNAGHGTLNGCTFCHIGSNQGRALYIVNNTNGFIISGCQFWYNSIVISGSSGTLITGCEFGRDQNITIAGGNATIIGNCVFMNDILHPPVFNVSTTAKLRMYNCYGGNSGNLIQP